MTESEIPETLRTVGTLEMMGWKVASDERVKKLLRVREVQDRLGIGRSSVYRVLKGRSGVYRIMRPGSTRPMIVVEPATVEAILNESKPAA